MNKIAESKGVKDKKMQIVYLNISLLMLLVKKITLNGQKMEKSVFLRHPLIQNLKIALEESILQLES